MSMDEQDDDWNMSRWVNKEADSLKLKGNELFKQKKYDEAIVMFSQAIEWNPINAILYNNRAACYCAMDVNKYLTIAVMDVARAIELDLRYTKAYGRLAWIYHQTNAIPKAIIHYQRAINCLLKKSAEENMDCKTSTQLQHYQQQLQLCQSKASASITKFNINQYMKTNSHFKDKMLQKYRNWWALTWFGIPLKQIPPYTGSRMDGEKPLSENELSNEIASIVRKLAENAKAAVKSIDGRLQSGRQMLWLNNSYDKHPWDKGDNESVNQLLKDEIFTELQMQKEYVQNLTRLEKNRIRKTYLEPEDREWTTQIEMFYCPQLGKLAMMQERYDYRSRKITETIENKEFNEEADRYLLRRLRIVWKLGLDKMWDNMCGKHRRDWGWGFKSGKFFVLDTSIM
eukprot:400781_1